MSEPGVTTSLSPSIPGLGTSMDANTSWADLENLDFDFDFDTAFNGVNPFTLPTSPGSFQVDNSDLNLAISSLEADAVADGQGQGLISDYIDPNDILKLPQGTTPLRGWPASQVSSGPPACIAPFQQNFVMPQYFSFLPASVVPCQQKSVSPRKPPLILQPCSPPNFVASSDTPVIRNLAPHRPKKSRDKSEFKKSISGKSKQSRPMSLISPSHCRPTQPAPPKRKRSSDDSTICQVRQPLHVRRNHSIEQLIAPPPWLSEDFRGSKQSDENKDLPSPGLTEAFQIDCHKPAVGLVALPGGDLPLRSKKESKVPTDEGPRLEREVGSEPRTRFESEIDDCGNLSEQEREADLSYWKRKEQYAIEKSYMCRQRRRGLGEDVPMVKVIDEI